MTNPECRDLLGVIEDRHGLLSTIVTSQLPIKSWYEIVGDPTIVDAILDRLIHNAHKIKLEGYSMRRKHGNLTKKRILTIDTNPASRRVAPPGGRLRQRGTMAIAGCSCFWGGIQSQEM